MVSGGPALLAAVLLLAAVPDPTRAAGGQPLDSSDAAAAAAAADRVQSLPELGDLGSSLRMYSGWVPCCTRTRTLNSLRRPPALAAWHTTPVFMIRKRPPTPPRYLNVSGDSGADRRVFYSFTESERKPQEDPLVLWLEG